MESSLGIWSARPDAASFPYELVVRYIQTVGKHALPARFLAAMSAVRAAVPDADVLRTFLDCVLDKNDGRYCYQTYLALPLLEDLVAGPAPQVSPTQLVGQLMADLVKFELSATLGQHRLLPEGRPDAATLRKRLRHALKHVPRPAALSTPAALLDRVEESADPTAARELLLVLHGLEDPVVADRLALTVQPVHVLHDEYLFIRVLQSYEMIFVGLVASAASARDALLADRPGSAAAAVGEAANALRRAGWLFTLLATMNADAFRSFREFTQGASAIQSEQYKQFEVLCGRPEEDRMRSAAFDNVPAICAAVEVRAGSITGAYLEARAAGAFTYEQWAALDAALGRLEAAHQRWKLTHYALAGRMLGDAQGSGYTAGVPYLRNCMNNRLFWRLAGTADEEHLAESRTSHAHL